MSQKRQNQPSISGFFTKIPKISYNENPSKVDEKNEEKNEPNQGRLKIWTEHSTLIFANLKLI